MKIYLDHTIIHARDPQATAVFLADLLGIEEPGRLAHFVVLEVGPTSLDFLPGDGPISSRHFAFRVTEENFESIVARIGERGIPYWTDPFHKEPGRINRWDDGRGLYVDDPNGHVIEVISRLYGSGGCGAEQSNSLLQCPET